MAAFLAVEASEKARQLMKQVHSAADGRCRFVATSRTASHRSWSRGGSEEESNDEENGGIPAVTHDRLLSGRRSGGGRHWPSGRPCYLLMVPEFGEEIPWLSDITSL